MASVPRGLRRAMLTEQALKALWRDGCLAARGLFHAPAAAKRARWTDEVMGRRETPGQDDVFRI